MWGFGGAAPKAATPVPGALQGRGTSVSDAVLDAVARVLRLDETEHAYLRTVARPHRAKKDRTPTPRIRPGVQVLLDGMDRMPAAVRNIPRHVFLDPASRDLCPDGVRLRCEARAAQTAERLALLGSWATTAS